MAQVSSLDYVSALADECRADPDNTAARDKLEALAHDDSPRCRRVMEVAEHYSRICNHAEGHTGECEAVDPRGLARDALAMLQPTEE